jgi:hypothetical protein
MKTKLNEPYIISKSALGKYVYQIGLNLSTVVLTALTNK